MNERSLADLIILSATMGVPLTWREVRYLHTMIGKAHASYVKGASPKVYRIFDAATPDGAYALEPGGEGLRWVSLALPIGTCSAQYSTGREPGPRLRQAEGQLPDARALIAQA